MRSCLKNEQHQFVPKKLDRFEYYQCILCHKNFSRGELLFYANALLNKEAKKVLEKEEKK